MNSLCPKLTLFDFLMAFIKPTIGPNVGHFTVDPLQVTETFQPQITFTYVIMVCKSYPVLKITIIIIIIMIEYTKDKIILF